MSSKKKKQSSKVSEANAVETTMKPSPVRSVLFPFLSYKMEIIGLLVLTFILYVNTIWGNYVLDDVVSVTANHFVQQGFAGIHKILTTNSMHGFNDSALDLQGGRYRPFPLLIFAIEHQFWGNNPHLNHVVTLLVWMLAVCVIYKLLRTYFFAKQPDIAIISTLIFIVHPIHTEVVANIKSVDEIYSLLFLISSVTLLFKYVTGEHKNIILYIASLLLFFIALFSKEYGLTFIFIIPLMIHVFTDVDIKSNLKLIIPYIVLFIIYLAIRFLIVGLNSEASGELLNNPFLYANAFTKLATCMVCLFKYLGLLVFPFPLSYDYSYNQIPIVGFDNMITIISLCMYSAMFLFALLYIKRKNILAFSILYFMISIFITSNILIDIGALMGERFLFQPSLGFSIFVGYGIYFLINKIQGSIHIKSLSAIAFCSIIIIIFGYKTIARNFNWQTEYSLYLTDVKASPNSTVANNYAGTAIINFTDNNPTLPNKNELLQQSLSYLRKSYAIYNGNDNAHINAIIACIRMGKLEDAEQELNTLIAFKPHHYRLYELNNYLAGEFNVRAHILANKHNLDSAIYNFEKAAQHDSTNATYWYDIGGASYTNKNYQKAYRAWMKCIAIQPNYPQVANGLAALKDVMK